MMSCDEFRQQQHERRRREYEQCLPDLIEQERALWTALQPIFDEMREHRGAKAHVREKIYAKMEGRDWTLMWLSGRIDEIEKYLKVETEEIERIGGQ